MEASEDERIPKSDAQEKVAGLFTELPGDQPS